MSRAGLALASVFVVLVGTFPAAANAAFAGPYARGGSGGNGGNHGHGGGGGSAICGSSAGITNCGFDVSYPQCGSTLPSPTAFAIVGVNGGLANDYNSCLESELSWAWGSSGSTNQPPVSLYVNTADPGNMYNGKPIADWPKSSGKADPYGSCTTTTVTSTRGKKTYTVGENSNACAWQYGYDMAQGDVNELSTISVSSVSGDNSPGTYTWWLDVETANSWQLDDPAMNIADLEGMIYAFEAIPNNVKTVGVYSTTSQWDSITGTTLPGTSTLNGIPNWIPGATSESGAQTACSDPSFTGGSVSLTQWTGTVDSDYACPSA